MAHKLSSIRMDGCIRVLFPELSRQIDISGYAHTALSALDSQTLDELNSVSGGVPIRFRTSVLRALRFTFPLSDFYIRQTTTKTLFAGTVPMLIRAGGDVHAETLFTNKLGSTDKITLRTMDGNKMRNLDTH